MNTKMKALYIIVNAGFAETMVEFIRSHGATGATIFNARGSNPMKKIMGISVGVEKEIVLSLIDAELADKILEEIKQDPHLKAEARAIGFTLPVDKTVGLS